MSDEFSSSSQPEQNPYAPPTSPIDASGGVEGVIPDQIAVRIDFSAEYIAESIARAQAHQTKTTVPTLIIGFWMTCVVVGLFLSWVRIEYEIGVAFLGSILSMILLVWISNRRSTRQYGESPFAGDQLDILLTADGYESHSDRQQSRCVWSTFTRAVFLDDGTLLFQGPLSCYWIPVSAVLNPEHERSIVPFLQSKIEDTDDRRRK